MNNIIKTIILIFAMSFLSGQVLAQSKVPLWAATPKLDKQIAVAKKANDKAKLQKLVKTKRAVLAKRKKMMATPKLDKQIAAARKAKDKAKLRKLQKTKRAVISKRMAGLKK